MFLSEDGLKVVRVDYSIASIPPFRINIPSSSESIWFGAKMTWTESNDKVKLGEILGPPHLPSGQYLGSRKILKVLMICNNVNRIGWTFQIVSPNLESFKDSKQFLVICIVVQLCHSKSVRVKDNWINFIIFVNNREDCSESIVWSICFHNKLSIGNLMSKDRSRGECFLERVESILTGGVKTPQNILSSKVCQWNDNVQVVKDKLVVKVCKT